MAMRSASSAVERAEALAAALGQQPIEVGRVVAPLEVLGLPHQPQEERDRRPDAEDLVFARAPATSARSPRRASRPRRSASRSASRRRPAPYSRRRRRRRRACRDRTAGRRRADQARRRHEALVGILGVDAALDRVAARRQRARRIDRRAARRARCGSATAPGRRSVTISVTGCSTCSRVFISRK